MTFSFGRATSVELCVSEWVAGSRYKDTTTIVAEQSNTPPLLDMNIFRLPPAKHLTSWRAALAIRHEAIRTKCDLIVVQQHIATAARIAAFSPRIPVILQTHNLIDPPATKGRHSAFKNWLVKRRFNRLAGITLVSEAARNDFEANWPTVTLPRAVITNGFDFSQWQPSDVREKVILVVGRATDEKGILEAAEGVVAFLKNAPDWSAKFILSEAGTNPAYMAAVRAALQEGAPQATLLTQVPYPEVRAMTERAGIVLVASKWREPFGRTALEAHAGGAALISSGTGGLREISGDCAHYINEVTGPAIAQALHIVAGDDALRSNLGKRGALRVRRLFSIENGADMDVPPISQRLDDFYARVLKLAQSHEPRLHAHSELS